MKTIDYLKSNNVDVDKGIELLGDINTYNEMMGEFQKNLDNKLSKIQEYYINNDMPNYAIFVHSLKSDCKYFGFTKLADMAYEHELASKAGNTEFVKNNYEALVKESNNVKNIVNTYFEKEQVEILNEDNNTNDNIILVADDSEVVRIFVKKIFESQYKIESAKDGNEALEVINKHRGDNAIKAILLDLNMPNVDGFKVLEYMKINNLFESMKVSIISGDSSKESIEKAFSYPIVDMLDKPFSEDKIKDVVQRTINK